MACAARVGNACGAMAHTAPRVLIVADHTETTESLLHAVRRRAAAGSADFHVLVAATDGERNDAVGSPDPIAALAGAIYDGGFDEFIVPE
jgi:hypothetical protein